MAELRMNAEEWRTIMDGLLALPKKRRDPHWHRAWKALTEFLAPIVQLRADAGDPRKKITDVVCYDCSGAITPGHNYVFEPSNGASFHTKCWVKTRVA